MLFSGFYSILQLICFSYSIIIASGIQLLQIIHILYSVYVQITWAVTSRWRNFHAENLMQCIFTEKNIDVFKTSLSDCIFSVTLKYY